ncbi:MAG: SPOR domain-containing protein [Fidelibacterota bacterium]|jgi:tetratricopeptide (TPR) repeat protein|tara:strand:- start:70 stop:915 length:846 start_codon:yes stop_codon:yes gene_type:complete
MIRNYLNLVFLFGFVAIYPQNINLYLTLLEKGRISEVTDNLPELLDRYPNEAGVYYIEALVNQDGESSISQFKKIINNFPNSEFAAKSEMKIGEYFFARGLYSQASIQLKKVIYKYVDAKNHQRALDLMINSYMATGQEDSAKVALKMIKQLYPSLIFDKYGIVLIDKFSREVKLVRLNSEEITKKIKSRKKKKRKPLPKDLIKPWVIQVGAFGKYENANRLKKQIQGNGYSAEVHAVNSNGNRLHAVRIVRFISKKDAEKIGKGLKKKFGLDFRVLNNPE